MRLCIYNPKDCTLYYVRSIYRAEKGTVFHEEDLFTLDDMRYLRWTYHENVMILKRRDG